MSLYPVTMVFLGFLLDLLFGDPHWLPHPVRLIGWLISRLEAVTRRIFPKDARGERLGGMVCTLLVLLLTTGAVWGLLWAAGRVHRMLAYLLEVLLCYQAIAAHSLRTESMKVLAALKKGDLSGARKAVAMIVGRDTANLSPTQVTRAAVETVAENASDGVVAPLFFLMLGGAPLGYCYKAVNTLDSMIGYKNDRYLHFGRFAARLDDFANFLPARICAVFMILSVALLGMDARGAARIWQRDRRCHASPNSAQTEAVCAGALGIQLAGDAYYGGVLVAKPTIGDDIRSITENDIRLSNRLMYCASILALCVFGVVKALCILIF